MSQGEKETVVRATQVRAKLRGDGSWLQQRKEADADASDKKVRTKLRGDGSWLQQNTDPQSESAEEKPWMAEVRSGRLNGANGETSPVSSPSRPTPPRAQPETERTPAAGYLIRGVFTQLDKPAASQTSNSFSKRPQFTKKPSETYKKIAPHTVKSTSDTQEGSLSKEEQEKRTEAASSVLRKSAARQRSYVLSAAKIFESQEADTTPLDKTGVSFVARRVEITEEDDGAATPPSVASAPLARPRKIADTMNRSGDPFEHMKPGCTKVVTPPDELISEPVHAGHTETEGSDVLGQLVPPLVEPTAEIPTAPPVPESPALVSDPPESKAPAIAAPESTPLASLTPESPAPAPSIPEPSSVTEVRVETEPESEDELHTPSSSSGSLIALIDFLESIDNGSNSTNDDIPVQTEEEEFLVDGHTKEDQRSEQEPAPELSNHEPQTDDLLALSDGPEAPTEPVPPSPGRWSQDLLSGLDSLGMQQEEEKQTAEGTQSSTETVTTSTKTVIITDKSGKRSAGPCRSHVTTAVAESNLADPFDPYPIGTTSSNSSSDLLQPHSDISINSASPPSSENKDPHPETNMSSNALESLADDMVPIDTAATRLSTRRSWATTWDTSVAQEADGDKSQDAEPEGGEKMLVMFERKSAENSSPWDRWTLPTAYTVTTSEDEEESPEDTQTQTVTTITTVRETQSEPKPAPDPDETSSRTWTQEDQRVDTPSPEGKKPFVYVKYVDATEELAMHNANDGIGSGSDYLTSTSNGYAPSSPSIYSSGSLSSTCTYCGELVGNNARISIEHLNINCHPSCFKCAVCSKPMGDLLDSMFIHGGKVNCENCYVKALE